MRRGQRVLRVLRIVIAFAAVVLLHASASRAQPAPPPEGETPPAAEPPAPDPDAAKKEEAKQRFLKGLELARSNEWDAALVEFFASRELFPTRVATLNAARALTTLKRPVEALEMYETLLRDFGKDIQGDARKQVDQAMAKLRELIGEIDVVSDQPGTTVIIDGKERGITPLEAPVRVKAGTHSVRAFKEGFIPFEQQIMVAGGRKQTVTAQLKQLTKSGRLKVSEASGGKFEVIVDGAPVGETPWEGALAVGEHTVVLRGDDQMGTPPNTAIVEEGKTTGLTLQAVRLDAIIRVEPTPSNARVALDGVTVGNGVWEGAVPSGSHKVEVFAPGFIAFSEDVKLEKDKTRVLKVTLERNPDDPIWGDAFRPHVYVEAFGGGALAPSFGGSAGGFPIGLVGGVRGGFAIIRGFGVELTVGYLGMRSSTTRTIDATADAHVVSLTSDDFDDATRISGPLAALSASYQLLEDTPLTFRLQGGVIRAATAFDNGGTFAGTSRNPADPTEEADFTVEFDLKEREPNIWVPFVGGEGRFGYRISDDFMVDFGVGVMVMFPSSTPRRSFDGSERAIPFTSSPGNYPSGASIPPPGQVQLPRETGFGTVIGIMPTFGARYDF